MFADVYERIKRKNKILFSTDSACIAPLLTYLAPLSRRIAVMFALDCAEKPSQKLRMLTGEPLAEQTIEVCRAWAAGDVKMNAARRAILALHARAKNAWRGGGRTLSCRSAGVFDCSCERTCARTYILRADGYRAGMSKRRRTF